MMDDIKPTLKDFAKAVWDDMYMYIILAAIVGGIIIIGVIINLFPTIGVMIILVALLYLIVDKCTEWYKAAKVIAYEKSLK